MVSYNDVVFAKFPGAVRTITQELPGTATQPQVAAWLSAHCQGPAVPTAAQVVAAKAVLEADIVAQQAKAQQDEQDRSDIKGDNAIKVLLDLTPAQIDAWLAANVSTIADARVVLSRVIKVLVLLARRDFQ